MKLIGPSPVPKLADQADSYGWPFGLYTFADASPANEYFNPAVVEWHDRDYLIVRRRQGVPGTPGRNTLEAWLLKHNRPDRRHQLTIPTANPAESFEDPRAFVRGENLILSFCTFEPVQVPGQSSTGFAHQAMTGVNRQFHVEPPVSIKFGCNGERRELNTGHEKNWCPFLFEGRIHISYSLADARHVVVATGGARAQKAFYGRCPTWPWGTLRGGTCPVPGPDQLLWTFFHSATSWYGGKRRYHMGALAFAPEPPFHVVRFSPAPLLSASELDFRNQWAPPCVWPGGAIYREGAWLIALGINDNSCGWVQIPATDLEKLCYVTC